MRAIWLFSSAALLAGCSSNPPAVHRVGDSCTAASDCGSSLTCYSEISPGVCSAGCDNGGTCQSGAACAPLSTTFAAHLCLKICGSNADCGIGYVCCESLNDVCAPAGRCPGFVPVDTGSTLQCTPRVVANGGSSGPSSAPPNCQKPVANIALVPGAQVQSFGAHKVGDEISFDVPPGTGTISILQQVVDGGAPDFLLLPGGDGTNAIVPFEILGPDGGVYFNDDTQPTADLSVMEVAFSAHSAATASMTLPNTTQALSHLAEGGYPAGAWKMQVNDYAYECARGDPTTAGCSGGRNTQSYDVQIVTKPISANTATINLGFYLITESWSADRAIADGGWARFLDTLAGIFANAGVCLGTVSFYDLPAWAKTRYSAGVDASDLTPCGELDQMFTLSKAGGELPIFLVDDIGGSGAGAGHVIVGVDGSIPGPAGAAGTVHSGAVVNVSDLSTQGCGNKPDYVNCGSDEVAYIVAHESGHFMGLYHTSEGDGRVFDPLGDTPQCAATCDANRDGVLIGSDCNDDTSTTQSCGGADDLMFWLLSSQAKGLISPQQGRVMRANPIVYQGSGQ